MSKHISNHSVSKRFLLGFLCLLSLNAFSVHAQDGGVPPQDDGSQAVKPAPSGDAISGEVMPAMPRADTPREEPATTTAEGGSIPAEPQPQVPTVATSTLQGAAPTVPATPPALPPTPAQPKPVIAPVVEPSVNPTSAVLEENAISEPSEEETKVSPFLLPLLTALAVVPFGFFIAGRIKKQKKREDEPGGRCFDLKMMLEEKLKELTDLRARLESEATSMAKDKMRSAVAGTQAGELLALVEKAEKEYHRVEKLFDECMIDAEGEKGVIILDTDIGYDPDDAFALVLLDRLAGKKLKLIVTADEVDGKRAQLTKKLLRLLGNTHTRVVSGKTLGLNHFITDTLIYDEPQTDAKGDYLKEMEQVVQGAGKVTYIGIGGFTNLATFINAYPGHKDKIKAFIMGGAIDYERRPGWVEHNVRIDMLSAQAVVESGWDISLVGAHTTHNPVYEINQGHVFYKQLTESEDPVHQFLAAHTKLWFNVKGFATSMHDPLTVAAALEMDYVVFKEGNVIMKDGRLSAHENGARLKWSEPKSRAQAFMDFLWRNIDKK